ncbi:MAG: YceH family protein [Trueperaceae bacterium]|nr:YceH family protein [Trueperaceae bacterium]
MPLSDPALRVLGSLLEKERTTPDAYPLSTQALVAACNQRTAREPVMDLHLREVEEGLQQLRDRGLAATVRASGERVPKHRQRFTDALSLTAREAALMAVLMLRGSQTAGELRTRTERYVQFPDVDTVLATLARLAERPTPLVRNRGRRPGQSQDRWTQTLGSDETAMQPRVRAASDRGPDTEASSTASDAEPSPLVQQLLDRVDALERRVAALEADAD